MSDESPKSAIRQDTLDVLGISFAEDVSRYIVPIFTDEKSKPMSTGTGFLLNTGFGHALVSAAHVLDGFREGRSYYFYATPKSKRAIAGTALFSKLPLTGRRDDDIIDVVVVLLEGDPDELPPFPEVGRDSLQLDLLAPQAVPRASKRYAFLGFPGSKGKVNPVARDVKSVAYSYLSSIAPPEVYAQLGLEETFHIVLPFDDRKIVSLDAKRINFPSVKGMSGSPLWELRSAKDGGRRVVGVMIERREKENVVIAADIWFVVKILADHYQTLGLLHAE